MEKSKCGFVRLFLISFGLEYYVGLVMLKWQIKQLKQVIAAIYN